MSAKRVMREAFGVTGFIPDGLAERIQEEEDAVDVLEVSVERGSADVVMRLDMASVDEVRLGATGGCPVRRGTSAAVPD